MKSQTATRSFVLAAVVAAAAGAPAWAQEAEPAPPWIDTPPPIDIRDAKPLPMPSGKGGGQCTDPNGGMVVYRDQLTGRTTYAPAPPIPPGVVRALQEGSPFEPTDGDGVFGRNMSDLTLVNNPEAWPYRAACKLLMEFVENDGSLSYYVCSATMIGPRHVLTAGHCIYTHDPSREGWANRVWVYPGYENGSKPYGEAQSIGMWSWTGWTANEDYNYDMGGLILARPIGALTGWYGYGFNESCSFFTGDYFYNNSYPAESAYGWSGEYMYHQEGTFDDCPGTNMVRYFKPGYGGMSGSSAYSFAGTSSRYAFAVASTSDRATRTTFCDMWSSMFYYIRDTRIPDDTPDSPDLIPLWTRTSDLTVNAGSRLADVSYYVHNNSDASFSGTVGVNAYLSTNDTISTGDTLIGSYGFGWSTGAKGTTFQDYPGSIAPIIAPDQPSGYYYVGMHVTNSDAAPSNNYTSGQDAVRIYVTGTPDLRPTTVNITNGSFNHGQTVSYNVTVLNDGGDPANEYTITAYASTNTTISTADTPLDSITTGVTLSPGASRSFSDSFVVPSSLAPGNYYFGVIISAVHPHEFVTTNNSGYDATTFGVTDLPDLAVLSVDAENGTHAHGDTITVGSSVTNQGSEPSGTYDFEIRASVNTTISTADPLLYTATFASLNPGQTRNLNTSVVIPGSLPAGDYYIGVRVVASTTEGGSGPNANYDPVTIRVVPCPADFDGNGIVNTLDFIAFLNAFNSGDRRADFDGNGIINTLDFIAFLNAFNAGC